MHIKRWSKNWRFSWGDSGETKLLSKSGYNSAVMQFTAAVSASICFQLRKLQTHHTSGYRRHFSHFQYFVNTVSALHRYHRGKGDFPRVQGGKQTPKKTCGLSAWPYLISLLYGWMGYGFCSMIEVIIISFSFGCGYYYILADSQHVYGKLGTLGILINER